MEVNITAFIATAVFILAPILLN
ncbi:unnamed protein product [Spirodela intermedia]|uniref:Uncharacterized protein n=2 Tax=Spirodela intermedia TaxID=51605 RepID=A0A7I8JS42_SPIIN|nr:unnamed protein product [Spirodela intermedia]CAA6672242.1 unnamed protein product [Spirodela intermedia]CAA7409399.1 unnamed protein product [Spirodela intermedia]